MTPTSPTVRRTVYDTPRYVDNGQDVIAPYGNCGTGIRCTVECAAGNHARVVNETYHFDKWVHVSNLRVEVKSTVEVAV